MAATKKIIEKLREYHFEFKHLTVLFVVLFIFQLIISFINKSSIKNFLGDTQEWYQKDSAERLANLTTTSLELLLETINVKQNPDEEEEGRMIQSFDIILSQQTLQHNIEELCILVKRGNNVYAIDDGRVLYSFLLNENYDIPATNVSHSKAISMYNSIQDDIRSEEEIHTILSDQFSDKQIFHTFVPFVLRGEYIGALYMKNSPDFSFITDQIISNYDETSIIYLSLILLGLLSMYFISSYTLKERDDAQKLLFIEHEENLKQQINYEKELIFTKRIYHTHHKAEKVMGFIKEDLRILAPYNIDEVKYRVGKYSNFISRVIYDMKWYDPPVQTIRNPLFKTNLNEVITFIVNNIFLRITSDSDAFKIVLDLDETMPTVPVNEFVIWEIIEPLIQNSLDHSREPQLVIKIKSLYNADENEIKITISDNGVGISPDLLEKDKTGIKKIFLENISTKGDSSSQNRGYGCYISKEMSKRCGWFIDAENLQDGGCRFTIHLVVDSHKLHKEKNV